MGPPPTGIEPALAYSPENRPAARSTLKSEATPSQETTSAASAAITSSARSTIASSVSLRSSEDVSDWPIDSSARTNMPRRWRSVTTVWKPMTPAMAPPSSRHGTYRASIQPLRVSPVSS